jgi:hypothetical protein
MPTKTLTGHIGGLVRWIGPAVLFLVGAGWLAGRTPAGSITSLGYFLAAILAFVLLVAALSIAIPTKLTISGEGFIWKPPLGMLSVPWTDVEAIDVLGGLSHTGSRIGFRFRPGAVAAQRRGAALNRSTTGYDRSIPNVWNMPTVELVRVLNEYMRATRDQAHIRASG